MHIVNPMEREEYLSNYAMRLNDLLVSCESELIIELNCRGGAVEGVHDHATEAMVFGVGDEVLHELYLQAGQTRGSLRPELLLTELFLIKLFSKSS